MTSEGLWEMFEGDFCRYVHQQISAGVDVGLSRGSSVPRPGSEDPHRRQRKFLIHLSEVEKIFALADQILIQFPYGPTQNVFIFLD